MKRVTLVVFAVLCLVGTLWWAVDLIPQKSRVSQETIAMDQAKLLLVAFEEMAPKWLERGAGDADSMFALSMESMPGHFWTRSAPPEEKRSGYAFGLLLYIPNEFPSNCPVVMAVTTPLTNYAGKVSRIAFLNFDGKCSMLRLQLSSDLSAALSAEAPDIFNRNPDLFYAP